MGNDSFPAQFSVSLFSRSYWKEKDGVQEIQKPNYSTSPVENQLIFMYITMEEYLFPFQNNISVYITASWIYLFFGPRTIS